MGLVFRLRFNSFLIFLILGFVCWFWVFWFICVVGMLGVVFVRDGIELCFMGGVFFKEV